jgi:hypothetical protein
LYRPHDQADSTPKVRNTIHHVFSRRNESTDLEGLPVQETSLGERTSRGHKSAIVTDLRAKRHTVSKILVEEGNKKVIGDEVSQEF